MIVSKAVKMAEMMNIPVLGIVENMSYFKAPDTGTEYKIFGDSHLEETAEKHGLEILAKIPVEPKLSAACDKGLIELFEGAWLEPLGKTLENLLERSI
jgi:Mrp family chromosome partitioning ATPase